MIKLILFTPVVLSIATLLVRSRHINKAVNLIYAAVFAFSTAMLYANPESFTAYFRVDTLNIFFLIILSAVYAGTSIYHIDFFRNDSEDTPKQSLYSVSQMLFVSSMACVILSTNIALLWVFIEATTLTSVYLIYYQKTDASIEAVWKYLFICSVGIAIAFVGIILLSMSLGKEDSLFFDDLIKNAGLINPFWLKLSFPFILVGFGTKAEFAPMHAWLPDAMSAAPSPAAALISGTLLNSALLAIIRMSKVMEAAGLGEYVKMLLIFTGFLSIFVTAVYIGIVKNFKRMLAYSSIENIGIILLGLGAGGPGFYAAMLHLLSHSLTKGSLFLTAGNIVRRYRTKEVAGVRGIIKGDKTTGWLWIISLFAITGFPPFPLFISEFLITKAFFSNGQYLLSALFFILLTVIMAGMAKTMLRMAFGEDNAREEKPSGIFAWMPQMVFLLILIIIGVSQPGIIGTIIASAADIL